MHVRNKERGDKVGGHLHASVRASIQGRASPCCFAHGTRDLKVVVHGDDFTVLGRDNDLDYFQQAIQAEFDVHKTEDDSEVVRMTTSACAS